MPPNPIHVAPAPKAEAPQIPFLKKIFQKSPRPKKVDAYVKPISTHVAPVAGGLPNFWDHPEQNAFLRALPWYQNCTFLIDETQVDNETRKCAVVDPGASIPFIISELNRLDLTVEKILLTHGHFDHANRAAELRDVVNAKILGPNKLDDYWFDNRFCSPVGIREELQYTPDKWLDDGAKITVGNTEWTAIHTPGHTPGHMIYKFDDGKTKHIQTGDALINFDLPVWYFRGGNFGQEIETMLRIQRMGFFTTFIPGHLYGGILGAVPLENLPFTAAVDYQMMARPLLTLPLKALAHLTR